MTVLPSLAAFTSCMPAERMRASDGMPRARSISTTDTPLLARFTTTASLSENPSSAATSRSWTAARRAGTSGVTGTRIRSARSKIARLRPS